MTNKITPPHIYLAEVSEELGLGSFSAKAFSRGETVEASPALVLTGKYKDFPIEIKHRVFNWGRLSQTKPDSSLALALGYGGYYNHSDTPNIMYKADSESMTFQFIARKNIAPNEQLTIHYNQKIDGSLPKKTTWFKNKKIEQTNV
jgi:uncharacterized protein